MVGAGSFIGRDCAIEEGAWLSSNVTMERDTQVGKRARIHSGVVLGSDGFGYEFEEGRQRKIPQGGKVIIGDDVEIGANTTIDRATIGSTIIGQGTKLDNLIQVGHNAEIGAHNVVVAQTGIAGSSKVGDHCQIGGQVGIAGHLQIGDRVRIAAQSGIGSNIADDATVQGSPAFNIGEYKRSYVIYRSLPALKKKVDELEKKIAGAERSETSPDRELG